MTVDVRRGRLRTHRVYRCGDVEADVDARTVRVDGRRVPATFVQFEMLLRLMEDPGRVLTRDALLILPGATARAVDIQIARLRKALAHAERFAIETVPHVGYRCHDRGDF
ncbi:MAG TPA: winged helix-turn-helix domain-containing protein [Dehalococcoidia bacterium]|nr:winged helix-turn-helix domain-containing protein [Dehalococcoidia bacterium]